MVRRSTIVLGALAGVLTGCAGTRVESGVVVNARTTARLDVVGKSPGVSIHNAGGTALPIEVGWEQVGREKSSIAPGDTRWWNPDGPRSFWLVNGTDRPIAVTYVVRNADVSLTMPAEK